MAIQGSVNRKDERRAAGSVRIKLRQARLALGLTHKEAAERAGYANKSGWAMVELGYNIPSAEQMDRMAAAVGKEPAAVFDEIAALVGMGERK